MDYKRDREKVTAIVPAYNEAKRIGGVLSVLTGYGFSEIIVVDDGSTDDTSEVVSKYKVKHLRLDKNSGKGAAMNRAVSETKTEFILFCDADVRGLTHDILDEIIAPVVDGKSEMFIAMRNRGVYALTWMIPIVPLLGGERALTKSLWLELPDWYKNKFRVESGLNFYAKYYGKGLGYKIFPNLSQIIKEKKYGFWKGTKRRFPMAWDIFYASLRAETTEIPYEVGRKRALYARAFGNIVSTILGGVVLYASYKGPLRFIYDTFSKEHLEDTSAVFTHLLIRIVTRVSVQSIAVVGVIIVVLNLFTTLLRAEKLRELSHVRAVARRKQEA